MTRAGIPAGAPSRFDVFLVDLGLRRGHEINKRRPCLVVSPDEINHSLSTIIIAPMTTGRHQYPWRVGCRFKGKIGYIILEQILCVDTTRCVRRLGHLDTKTGEAALQLLATMFTH